MAKYGNKIIVTEDGKFHSKRELFHFQRLKLLESQGLIKDLQRQVVFSIIVNEKKIGRYTADFVYIDPVTEKQIIDEVKGYKAEREWRRTKKLINALYPEFEIIES